MSDTQPTTTPVRKIRARRPKAVTPLTTTAKGSRAPAVPPAADAGPPPVNTAADGPPVPRQKYLDVKYKFLGLYRDYRCLQAELHQCRAQVARMRQEKHVLLDYVNKQPDQGCDSSEEDELQVLPRQIRGKDQAILRAGSKGAHLLMTGKGLDGVFITPDHNATTEVQTPTGGKTATTGARAADGKAVATTPARKTTRTKRKRPVDNLERVQAAPLPVEKDEQGNYKLPFTQGLVTLTQLGTVVYDREAFHNDRYIWPVGYTVRRRTQSMRDPNQTTILTCTILDGGEAPEFQIVADDMLEEPPFTGPSSSNVSSAVLKKINAVRNRDVGSSVSGPDFFGLTNHTIRMMIQDLPNADKCSRYIFKKYAVTPGSSNLHPLPTKDGGKSTATAPTPVPEPTVSEAASPALSAGAAEGFADPTHMETDDLPTPTTTNGVHLPVPATANGHATLADEPTPSPRLVKEESFAA
ncbi:hypothetical protein IWQ60_010563 [Tieghemiomyces parasiticus]|uniref:FYR N-terminal domain-containing protein n=1 Tax=Tieghemiomyces parasiticus TaxID=78921 RepID=A0A9W7ZQ54_9FUNG|nr:hypothetical protein IWQ60_010563 [Tieghemiomyces parasiticus]